MYHYQRYFHEENDFDNNETFDELFEEDICVNEVFQLESEFIDSEKRDKQYVLGVYSFVNSFQEPALISCCVTSKTFYQFSYSVIFKYLLYYGIYIINRPHSLFGGKIQIDIIQNHINEDDVYVAVVKTFWLKWIQRKWKNIMREREQIILQRKNRKM